MGDCSLCHRQSCSPSLERIYHILCTKPWRKHGQSRKISGADLCDFFLFELSAGNACRPFSSGSHLSGGDFCLFSFFHSRLFLCKGTNFFCRGIDSARSDQRLLWNTLLFLRATAFPEINLRTVQFRTDGTAFRRIYGNRSRGRENAGRDGQ